eukprot:GHVU01110201.1.p1 GENE.GHVU01110201.1~~GHVU01110201.1.p1  ORF type:complete len:207 (+),score=34.38 GHVU01110201.1:119-739(+)
MTEVKEKDCVNEEAEPCYRETVENSDGNIAAAAEVAPRRPPEGGGKSEAAEGEKTADGEFDAQEEAGLKELQALEEIAERQARSRTDIPDADFKPPENVLFICKLNPHTQAYDLEIMFVRFGKILSCDIIRDWKTNDSLQYGFIEFEKKESAEAAYFEMRNMWWSITGGYMWVSVSRLAGSTASSRKRAIRRVHRMRTQLERGKTR